MEETIEERKEGGKKDPSCLLQAFSLSYIYFISLCSYSITDKNSQYITKIIVYNSPTM